MSKVICKTNEDGNVFMNNEWVGKLSHSVGPYGNSSGWFRECRTVCPINEVGEILFPGCELIEEDGSPVIG